MKQALNPYAIPLIAFGPGFMMLGRSGFRGEPFVLALVSGTLPYVGAAMLTIGAMMLLGAVQKQQKELAELRSKLEALQG